MSDVPAPSVSVVIPTRNRIGTLAVALGSVLSQHDVPLEVVVVDEGSTDQTPRFLAAVARLDPRVRVVRHDEPRGLAGARNAGLATAQAPWVGFLDDDDVWHPDKLRKQLDAAERLGANWAFSAAVYVDGDLRAFHVATVDGAVEHLADANTVPAGGSGVLADRDLVRRFGGFDEALDAFEDWDCWLRLLEAGEPAVVADVLVGYRIVAGSMSHNVAAMQRALPQMTDRHPVVRVDSPVSRAAHSQYFALQYVRSGRRRSAAAELLSTRPRKPLAVAQAAWALGVGRPWTRPRWTRPARTRAQFTEAEQWLELAARRGEELLVAAGEASV